MKRQMTPCEVLRAMAGIDARIDAQFLVQEACDAVGMDRAGLAERIAISEGRLRHMAGPNGSDQMRLLGEAMRALGRRLVVTSVRLGPDPLGGDTPGPYRHWTRDLPEAGTVMRHADEIERLEAEVATHLAAAEAARRRAAELDALAVADASHAWSADDVASARRSAANV